MKLRNPLKKITIKPIRLQPQALVLAVLVLGVMGILAVPYIRAAQRDNNYDTTLEQARDLIDQKKYDDAEKILKPLSKSKKANDALWSQLGFVYQQNKKYSEAIEAYSHASQDKRDANSWNLLGNLFRDNKQYKEAETAYLEAIALSPNASRVIINLAHLYIINQDYDKARALLEKYMDTPGQTNEIAQFYQSQFKR